MNCKDFEKNMIDFIEGALSKAMQIAMQEHIDNCNRCKRVFQDVKSTYSLLGNEDKPELKPFFMTRLEQRIENEKENGIPVVRLQWLYSTAAAAIVVIGLALGVTIGKNISPAQLVDSYSQNSEIEFNDSGEDFGLISYSDYSVESYILEEKE
ncbi:MAG: zf-HC2 domain-containing protein [Bacteroidota bacterium]|nr:zf-HC2 domain-containing protein [Bacteroidota bacterium]